MFQKDIAVAFLKTAGMGDVREAFERFVAPGFIHHNQYFKGDRQSLLEAMEESHRTSPNKEIDIHQIYKDGETVITHSQVIRQDPNAQEIAVVHIFRFEGNLIAELWDLGMLLEKNSPNENGPF